MPAPTLEEALRRASLFLKEAGIEDPRLEAELLLGHVLGCDRLNLLLQHRALLTKSEHDLYTALLSKKAAGEPTAYLLGSKCFYGRPFTVNRDVLIPRPETELIVEAALKWVQANGLTGPGDLCGIDLGTGSGVIAISLALELRGSLFFATDICPKALAVAKKNALAHGVCEKICFVQGDFFSALNNITPLPNFNLITANPPYLDVEEMKSLPRSIKAFEPPGALNGGKDGLDSYRSILKKLPFHLRKPALVLLESGSSNHRLIEEMFAASGLFSNIYWLPDLEGRSRVFHGIVS